MKTHQYRNRSIVAAIAAALVTTVLISALVASFEPEQLSRLSARAGSDQIAAALRRGEASDSDWT